MTSNLSVHAVDRVLSALDELLDTNPDLEKAVDFYEELLPIMLETRPTLHGLRLNPDAALLKLQEGVPLLWGEYNNSDTPGSEPNMELFMTLCRLTTEGGNADGEVLMRAVLEGRLDLPSTLEKTMILDRAALSSLAQALTINLDLLETIALYTLSPIAQAYALAFGQALDFSEWTQGYCPVCGDWPILSELQGRDKLRYLRCGRCNTRWKFGRLQCLWCANRNREMLSFLFDTDHPTWRIDICDDCQGYIKTITTFDPLEADMLLAYDLKTMLLDHQAAGQGYKRPRQQPMQYNTN